MVNCLIDCTVVVATAVAVNYCSVLKSCGGKFKSDEGIGESEAKMTASARSNLSE